MTIRTTTAPAVLVGGVDMASRSGGHRLASFEPWLHAAVVAALGGAMAWLLGDRLQPSSLMQVSYVAVVSLAFGLVVSGPLGRTLRRADTLGRTGSRTVGLRRILDEMATASDLAGVVRRGLDLLMVELDVERVALFLAPRDGGDFVLVDRRGAAPHCDRVPAEHPLVDLVSALRIATTRDMLATYGLAAGELRQACTLLFEELGADVVQPVEAGDRVVGLLVLHAGRDARTLAEDDRELLQTIGIEIALCALRLRDADTLQQARADLERFARFLPPAIAEEIGQGRLPGQQGRRRTATVLVCDLPLDTERVGSDDLDRIIERHETVVADCVAEEDGTLAHVRGGHVVAVFGDPNPVLDHAARALRTALRIADATAASGALPLHDGRPRMGVASGMLTVGFMAIGARADHQVIGAAVNGARLLAAHAARGEVLAGASTIELARTAIDADAVDRVALVGEQVLRVRGIEGAAVRAG